jgi:SMP-30/Gluconolactonase/LRE-like region
MNRIGTHWIEATGLVLALGLGVMADEPAPLRYTTSWVGNSFGGGPEWVQNFAEGLCVLPDGTCVVGSFWDEAGREVGLYKGGRPVGQLPDTHMRGGKAIAASGKYIFYAHTCVREDQPGVGAGEARRDVPICLFGVARYTADGKAAPFPGGKTHLKNMVVFREAPDNHDLIARGLATDGKLLFLADTLQDRIRVFDVETMASARDFAAERPERLALDRSGNVWAIKSGGKAIASYSADGKAREIEMSLPSSSIATSLSFAPDGRLVVADNGPRQQLLFFDVSAKAAKLVDTFGEEGGMFAGPHPGRVGPTRLAGPTGAGYDAKGNLYVACNVPRGGTVLRAFAPDKTMIWEALGLEFVDVADAAPGSDGKDVLTADDRFVFDPSGPSGKNWKWTAHTLDPFRSPDDLRLHFPGLQCGTSVRVLGGKTFLCQRGMWQGILGLYRVDGDLATPSVVLSSGPLKEDKTGWTPPHQPGSGRWLWRDANGNGRFDDGEYTATDGPTGEYWASNVDPSGDIWQAGRDTGIWRWKFLGVDDHDNPRYDPKPDHRPMPAPFNDLLRTEYDPATDTMWLTGQTRDRPISNGEWGTAGTVAARYDGWSKGPSAPRFVVDFPYKPDATFMVSFCTAGDLFFAIDCKSAKVSVYDQEHGRLLGTLSPGPEVHGQSGWVDFRDGIRASRLGDGSYVLFAEEDWKAKGIAYHLQDPLHQGSR